MPFDEDEINSKMDHVGKKGLKLTNATSVLNNIPKPPSKEQFLKKATEVNQTLNEYAVRASTLALQFKKALNDQTLIGNKPSFAVDAERELLTNLVQLAIDMNTDEHELEGNGSVGIITLLMRSILIQRDKINALEYAMSLLEKKMKDLSTPTIDTTKQSG